MRLSTASRVDRYFAALPALAAALSLGAAARPAVAEVVYSGVVNINIPSTTAGIYLNVATGKSGTVASTPGWDVNPYSGGGLLYFSTAGLPNAYVSGGGTGTSTANLPFGTLISGSSTFGSGGAVTTGSFPHVLNSSDNVVGFRFQHEATGGIHYGWMRIALSADTNTQPRTIVEYAFEDKPGVGILAGARGSVLSAATVPGNNGSTGWAIFLDLEAVAGPLAVHSLVTGSTAAAAGAYSIDVFSRVGTAMGGTLATGPGSSLDGWTFLGTVPAVQGSTANGLSLPVNLPHFTVNPGVITGVALRFNGVGPRYTDAATITTFQDSALKITTGESRSAPFTTGGSLFAPRMLAGAFSYTARENPPSNCYANCDGSTTFPFLNVQDFSCFLTKFAAGCAAP